jgi:hypothetical protein
MLFNPNMDSGQYLPTGSYYETKIKVETGALHNSTVLSICIFEKVPVNQLFEKQQIQKQNY